MDKRLIFLYNRRKNTKRCTMKKKILAAVLAAMVLLVGCGAEEIPASIVPIQPQPIETQTKETSEDAS